MNEGRIQQESPVVSVACRLSLCIALGCLAGVPLWMRGAEAEKTEAPAEAPAAATIEIPKAVFVPDQEKGRDPFYPLLGWPGKRIAASTNVVPTTVTLEEKVERFVIFKGIIGQEGDQLALINNQTFKVGETNDVRIGAGAEKLKVTMLRVSETSVSFKVEGSDKEFEKTLAE